MPDQQPKASRREVLAYIALQDLPMPTEISFREGLPVSLAIRFDRVDTASQWESAFGGTFWGNPNARAFTTAEGRRWQTSVRYLDGWRGWDVSVAGSEPVSDAVDELDEDTSSKLRGIAGGDQ